MSRATLYNASKSDVNMHKILHYKCNKIMIMIKVASAFKRWQPVHCIWDHFDWGEVAQILGLSKDGREDSVSGETLLTYCASSESIILLRNFLENTG